MTGVRFLRSDEHHVVQAKCVLPSYVNWDQRDEARRVVSEFGVNIVGQIAVYSMGEWSK
jgi:hypothetical protein